MLALTVTIKLSLKNKMAIGKNQFKAKEQPAQTSQVELHKKSKRKPLIWASILVFVILLGIGGYIAYPFVGPIILRSKSSAECTKLAKVVIANNWPVKYINCEEESLAKISNSTLTGHYIYFTAGNKLRSCVNDLALPDPGMNYIPLAPNLSSDNCSQWEGAVLSNGQYFYSVGRPTSPTEDSTTNFANINHSCASVQYLGSNGGGSAKHDLYMYQGKLYDRYVYLNYVRKIALGSCTFNGTVLVGRTSTTSLMDTELSTITNIQITYNTPRDCFAGYAGKINDKSVLLSECLAMAASAYQDSSICHVTQRLGVKPYAGSGPIVVYPLNGVGSNVDFPYTDTECLDLFTNHMAWLNKCSVISDPTTRTKCDTSYNRTNKHLKLVTGNI